MTVTNEGIEVFALPNPSAPDQPVVFNEAICNGCNKCVEVCQMDVFIPNPEKGKPPIILYPDECWYGGCCVHACPHWWEGAVKLNHPVMQRVRWKRKATREHFRIGMPNPLVPNLRPPVGGWNPKV